MSNTIVPIKKTQSSGSSSNSKTTMKGLVYNGPGMVEWKEVLKPSINKQKALKIILTS